MCKVSWVWSGGRGVGGHPAGKGGLRGAESGGGGAGGRRGEGGDGDERRGVEAAAAALGAGFGRSLA